MNHIQEAELEMKKLYSAMAKLDADQRVCLELIYFHDKSYREISVITGFDPGIVKSYIQNGKRNLKLLLEKDHGKE
jgi:RNA polymerase sigma-70 factor (ECF subfamily)